MICTSSGRGRWLISSVSTCGHKMQHKMQQRCSKARARARKRARERCPECDKESETHKHAANLCEEHLNGFGSPPHHCPHKTSPGRLVLPESERIIKPQTLTFVISKLCTHLDAALNHFAALLSAHHFAATDIFSKVHVSSFHGPSMQCSATLRVCPTEGRVC